MEFLLLVVITIILVIIMVPAILWTRTGDLARRLDRTEAELRNLQLRFARLEGVAKRPVGASAEAPAAVSEAARPEAAPLEPAPAPAPAVASARVPEAPAILKGAAAEGSWTPTHRVLAEACKPGCSQMRYGRPHSSSPRTWTSPSSRGSLDGR